MTLPQAMVRIPPRCLPNFWIGDSAKLSRHLRNIRLGRVSILAKTPGGRRLHLVTYGKQEKLPQHANFNSAVGGRDIAAYLAKDTRRRPVILFVGPVHGHETEGLTGLMNLIHVLETGQDLAGRAQPQILALARQCRLLIVPIANPDGLARFHPASLQGMNSADLRFWGQGTWRDGRICGWPECKRLHPMDPRKANFLGCYFNDRGVNPMHDEFLNPLGPEAPAILKLAEQEGPDLVVSLHSHEPAPAILRPAHVPLDVQAEARTLAAAYYHRLRQEHLPHGPLFRPQAEKSREEVPFNLVSALYHISGATAFTFECSHGLKGGKACAASFDSILRMQLLLYEAMMAWALQQKRASQVSGR